MSDAFSEAQEDYDDTGAVPYHLRRPEQFAAFFEGLDVVDPAAVPTPRGARNPASRPAESGRVRRLGIKAHAERLRRALSGLRAAHDLTHTGGMALLGSTATSARPGQARRRTRQATAEAAMPAPAGPVPAGPSR